MSIIRGAALHKESEDFHLERQLDWLSNEIRDDRTLAERAVRRVANTANGFWNRALDYMQPPGEYNDGYYAEKLLLDDNSVERHSINAFAPKGEFYDEWLEVRRDAETHPNPVTVADVLGGLKERAVEAAKGAGARLSTAAGVAGEASSEVLGIIARETEIAVETALAVHPDTAVSESSKSQLRKLIYSVSEPAGRFIRSAPSLLGYLSTLQFLRAVGYQVPLGALRAGGFGTAALAARATVGHTMGLERYAWDGVRQMGAGAVSLAPFGAGVAMKVAESMPVQKISATAGWVNNTIHEYLKSGVQLTLPGDTPGSLINRSVDILPGLQGQGSKMLEYWSLAYSGGGIALGLGQSAICLAGGFMLFPLIGADLGLFVLARGGLWFAAGYAPGLAATGARMLFNKPVVQQQALSMVSTSLATMAAERFVQVPIIDHHMAYPPVSALFFDEANLNERLTQLSKSAFDNKAATEEIDRASVIEKEAAKKAKRRRALKDVPSTVCRIMRAEFEGTSTVVRRVATEADCALAAALLADGSS